MSRLYDFDKLTELLSSLYLLTGRKITLKNTDVEDVITNTTPSPYCRLIQSTAFGYNLCMQCDAQALRSIGKKNRPVIYRCHAGLLEVGVPVREREELMAYLMIGQVLDDSPAEEQWAKARRQVSWYEDQAALCEAYLNTEQVSVNYLRAYADVISACASYIWMRDYVKEYASPLVRALEHYVDEHYMENLSLEEIARELNLGRTKLCETAQEFFGCSVHDLIRQRRMRAAENLLSSTDMPVAEVAEAVGYRDSSYFVKCFKRHCGETPLRYRRRVIREYGDQRGSDMRLFRPYSK